MYTELRLHLFLSLQAPEAQNRTEQNRTTLYLSSGNTKQSQAIRK